MNKLVSNITIALILIFTQGLFFNNINFLGSINPFVYVFFIVFPGFPCIVFFGLASYKEL